MSELSIKSEGDLETRTARVLSKIFTPFFMAALASVVFSWFSPIESLGSMSRLSSVSLGVLTLCLGPLVPVLYSARIGRTDLDVSDATKRPPLYALGLMSYAAGASIFYALDNRMMFSIAFAYVCVGLAQFIITLAWKISAHTAGIAGPTAAIAFVFGPWILPLYLLSFVLIWARVKLSAHTLSQAIAGVLVAMIVTNLVYLALYP